MKKITITLIISLFICYSALSAEKPSPSIEELTVFVAKSIITMEPSMPEATAVAVANGRIVSVGTLESLKPWTKHYKTSIDNTFKDKVIMPGFIDTHIHPSLPAVLTLFPFIAPDDWNLPTGQYPKAKNQDEYISTLQQQVKNYPDSLYYNPDIPFITWGFHQLWHGEIYRSKLDELFPDTPVILWHRSFHELIANTATIKALGVSEEASKNYPHDIDWDKGLFTEYGGKAVFLPKLMPKIFTKERYAIGMKNFVQMLHQGGVTTGMDMGVGIFGDADGEIAMVKNAMKDAPARIVLTPLVTDFISRKVTPDQALKQVMAWEKNSTQKVFFDGHFKLMMDGAAFSGLGQMDFPGYIDGHKGLWMSPLEVTYQYAETFWNAGYQLHAHTNGDLSAKELINIVMKLQQQKPRMNHRTVLEHFMDAKEDQIQRMSDLGMAISANPYYQFILADMYAENWLGEDRARNMSPLGSVIKADMRLALHSDAPMAPLSPLTLVDTTVNRETINGNKNNKTQALSIEEALRGVTIDAAWMMRMEDSIGSIIAGKKADFAILEKNPLRVHRESIKDIKIWGTVYEGMKYPIQ